MALKDWSTTPSTNANADSQISLPEGMAASAINDEIRDLMAVLKGDFANSLAANGYQKLPNGTILQWGTRSAGDQVITFPTAFPTACVYAGGTIIGSPSTTTLAAVWISSISATSFGALPRIASSGGAVSASGATFYWFAVGY